MYTNNKSRPRSTLPPVTDRRATTTTVNRASDYADGYEAGLRASAAPHDPYNPRATTPAPIIIVPDRTRERSPIPSSSFTFGASRPSTAGRGFAFGSSPQMQQDRAEHGFGFAPQMQQDRAEHGFAPQMKQERAEHGFSFGASPVDPIQQAPSIAPIQPAFKAPIQPAFEEQTMVRYQQQAPSHSINPFLESYIEKKMQVGFDGYTSYIAPKIAESVAYQINDMTGELLERLHAIDGKGTTLRGIGGRIDATPEIEAKPEAKPEAKADPTLDKRTRLGKAAVAAAAAAAAAAEFALTPEGMEAARLERIATRTARLAVATARAKQLEAALAEAEQEANDIDDEDKAP